MIEPPNMLLGNNDDLGATNILGLPGMLFSIRRKLLKNFRETYRLEPMRT